jgi:hypothetical protein
MIDPRFAGGRSIGSSQKATEPPLCLVALRMASVRGEIPSYIAYYCFAINGQETVRDVPRPGTATLCGFTQYHFLQAVLSTLDIIVILTYTKKQV